MEVSDLSSITLLALFISSGIDVIALSFPINLRWGVCRYKSTIFAERLLFPIVFNNHGSCSVVLASVWAYHRHSRRSDTDCGRNPVSAGNRPNWRGEPISLGD